MRSDLRQPMDVGRIIDWALRIYRLQFSPFFLIAALTVPLNMLAGVLQVNLDLGQGGARAVEYGLILAAVFAAGAFVNYLATSAIAFGVAEVDRNMPVDFGRAYDVVFVRLRHLIVAGLRVWIPALLLTFTIIGFPVAIWLFIRWSFIGQAVMIDTVRGSDAPGHSARLVAGTWWRVFGILLLVGLVAVVPQAIVAEISALGPALVAALVTSATAAFVLPFIAIAHTLLYFDLSARKESDVSPA